MSNPLLAELAQLPAALVWTAQMNIGGGFYHALWTLALLYCLILGRRGGRGDGRLRLMGLALLLLLAGWPFIVGMCRHYGFYRQYYPRFAWLLMVELLLAAAGADLVRRQQGGWRKGAALLAVIAVIGVCGQSLFTERFFQRSNPYKLLDETIAVADYLAGKHPGTRAYISRDICVEIRQYDAAVLLVFGRPAHAHQLETALNHDQWRAQASRLMQRWNPFEIIVLAHADDHEDKLNQLGWRVEKRIGRYDVYSRTKGS